MPDVSTDGGAQIGGDVGTGGGDVVGRDQRNAGNEINIFPYDHQDRLEQIHFQLQCMEDNFNFRMTLVERDLVALREELSKIRSRQSNYPTWFQVLMIVVAGVLLIVMMTFISKIDAAQKQLNAMAPIGSIERQLGERKP